MELQFLFSVFAFFGLVLFSIIKLLPDLRRSKPPENLPPQPWKLPLLGHLHHLIGTLPHLALADLASKLGPIIHLQLGEVSAIVISSSRLAKDVMKTHDLAFADRPKLLSAEIVGYNYGGISFAPYGDYWRQMRKIGILELLSAKKVRSFRSIREEESWNLIKSIQSSVQGTPINLSKKIFAMMNIITCRVSVGSRCKDQDLLIALLKELISLSSGFDVSDLFPSIKLLHLLTGMRTKLKKIRRKMDKIFDTIISDHQEICGSSKPSCDNVSHENEDLLDVLLRIKDDKGLQFPITYDNIKAVILELFAAGTDTSSVTIEWAMSELMRNPRVMEKAQAELRQTLKGKEKICEIDVENLNYLNIVIKETLRLHPPAPFLLPRECRESCEIDGYTIPVNTKVLVNVWKIGRDPDYWNDAESFVPERFNDCPINFIGNDFEYLPFGSGRRMCPGLALGLANVELPLARLLYHFNWKLPNGAKSGDLDMSENLGVVLNRKTELFLLPISYNTLEDACQYAPVEL